MNGQNFSEEMNLIAPFEKWDTGAMNAYGKIYACRKIIQHGAVPHDTVPVCVLTHFLTLNPAPLFFLGLLYSREKALGKLHRVHETFVVVVFQAVLEGLLDHLLIIVVKLQPV